MIFFPDFWFSLQRKVSGEKQVVRLQICQEVSVLEGACCQSSLVQFLFSWYGNLIGYSPVFAFLRRKLLLSLNLLTDDSFSESRKFFWFRKLFFIFFLFSSRNAKLWKLPVCAVCFSRQGNESNNSRRKTRPFSVSLSEFLVLLLSFPLSPAIFHLSWKTCSSWIFKQQTCFRFFRFPEVDSCFPHSAWKKFTFPAPEKHRRVRLHNVTLDPPGVLPRRLSFQF